MLYVVTDLRRYCHPPLIPTLLQRTMKHSGSAIMDSQKSKQVHDAVEETIILDNRNTLVSCRCPTVQLAFGRVVVLTTHHYPHYPHYPHYRISPPPLNRTSHHHHSVGRLPLQH
jgi:hypothetical protein